MVSRNGDGLQALRGAVSPPLSAHKDLFGIAVLLLVWTDGHLRIPLAFRVWHKGGPSKFDLALELLSYARNRLVV